jgi:very-short-patch-repair endonuclease
VKTDLVNIYLAGKVNGKKVELSQKVTESVGRKSIKWLRSDGKNHSEHSWGFASYAYNSSSLRDWLEESFISRLAVSDFLLGYVETPDSFGTIAEIAYASSRGKHSYLLIQDCNSPESSCSCGHGCGDCGFPNPLYDAYWFVSHFPNVTAIQVSSFDRAVEKAIQICRMDSPIEHKLFQSLCCRHYDNFQTQFKIGQYRVDFAYEYPKIAIEVDGHEYHSTKEQRGRDAQRDRFIQAEGWRVLRYTGTEVFNNPDKCASEINSIVQNFYRSKPETPLVNFFGASQ